MYMYECHRTAYPHPTFSLFLSYSDLSFQVVCVQTANTTVLSHYHKLLTQVWSIFHTWLHSKIRLATMVTGTLHRNVCKVTARSDYCKWSSKRTQYNWVGVVTLAHKSGMAMAAPAAPLPTPLYMWVQFLQSKHKNVTRWIAQCQKVWSQGR